jgi:hypothetical protein
MAESCETWNTQQVDCATQTRGTIFANNPKMSVSTLLWLRHGDICLFDRHDRANMSCDGKTPAEVELAASYPSP